MKQKISVTIDEKVLRDIDGVIDNLYIRNRSQAIEFLARSSLVEKKTAVILAGGEEKRLELARGVYSPTARVGGKTVVENAARKLRESGFREIFVIARHNVLTAIFDTLKDGSAFGMKVNYVEEKKSEGTAESLKIIKGKVTKAFLVVYADVLFNNVNISELWTQHAKSGHMATIMLTTSGKPSEKGTVTMEGSKVVSFVQKKKADSYLVFSPIFAAEPELLEQPGSSLERDVFPKLAEKGLLQGHVSAERERHVHAMADVRKG